MISTGICRWLFLLISLSTWTTKLIDAKDMRIVCYYTNWSVYRPGQAKFSPQNINPYLCTHLVYAFGGFTKENTLKPFDKYQDIEKGGYAKFTGLKTYNKNLKTLIAIGGWNEGSSRFSPMVANADRRKELVKNAIKFLRQNHFDGLDLDWEYPTFRDGGKPRDRDNYAQLVQELREEFERESEKTGRPRLLLTMAVPAGIEYINKGYDVPKLTKYLDWMNILSYDYHSAFEPAVNHHAPLYSLEEDNEYNYDAELNIDYTIKHYLKMGADPAKLVLGIPTYGRSYTLFNPDAYEIGSPADGPGDMGEATRENGYLAYYEVCDYVKNQDWEVEEPNSKAMGPIAFKGNQWVGYDDENIVRKKAEYVVENGLGGIMFWAIDNDDFRGNCHGKPYPLIEAGKEAMLNAYGINDDNLISPPTKPTKSSKLKTRTRPNKTTTTEQPEEASVSSTTPRRRRIKPKHRNEETSKRRKSDETSTYSNLKIVTPAYTTPEPPATPDMGGAFKCEDEGFFPHPKDCKKYFWCLSGAGDSGIVAHSFTCPAGLYFNKAADSCDYSQNVFCNKKLQKAPAAQKSATATTEASATAASIVSTTRAPPKITAATSKTTINFRSTTTTTEAPEEDEEYEYEEEEEEEPTKKISAEEDPRVIKELIDLIRKAGGIEELEKQLNLGKDSSSSTASSDTTTPSAISKSLFERVLSKTNKNSWSALRGTGNRNSGGPQGSLSEEVKENKVERGRPQYRTLSRQRSTTEAPASSETQEKEVKSRTSSLEYVNIRRPKTSSTTEANEDDGGLSRNKILGELDVGENRDNVEESEPVSRKTNTPQYTNIRRQRLTTTEGTPVSSSSSSPSRYISLRRSTVSPVDPETETELNQSNSNIIRRGFTTTSTSTEASSSVASLRYQTIRRGTTTTASPITEEVVRKRSTTESASTAAPEEATTTFSSSSPADEGAATENDVLTTSTPDEVTVTSSVKTLDSENIVTSTQKTVTESNNSTIASSPSEQTEAKKKRPLFHPKPFSAVATTTVAPSTTSKVSPSFRSRVRSSTEPTLATSTTTVRARTRSRFSNVNRNLSEDVEQEEKYSRTVDNNKPLRSRKRLVTTTEKVLTDSNEDYNRAYRPAGELSDLSSLTAVDLNLKSGEFVAQHRRRRPGVVPTSVPTSSTVRPPNATSTKSSEQTTPIRKVIVRGGFRLTTAAPSDNVTTVRTRKIIRKFRPTGLATPSTEESPRSSTLGGRRIALFRQRASTTQATPATESPLLQLFNTQSRFDVTKSNTTTEESDEVNGEQPQEEDIKLSESNIRESSQINAFGLDEKPSKKVVLGKNDASRVRIETTTKAEATTPLRRVRTRKIVRKLPTTTSTTTSSPATSTTTKPVEAETTPSETKSTTSRRRKVFVRRLGPVSTNQLQSQIKSTTTTSTTTSTTTTERTNSYRTSESVEEVKPRRVFRPTSSTTETPEASTKPYRLSLYTRPSYIVSTEPEEDNADEDVEEEEDEEDDDEEHHFDPFMVDDPFMEGEDNSEDEMPVNSQRSTPGNTYVYSFKRTHQFESSMNFNDDDDPDKRNKTVSKVILTTTMNKNNTDGFSESRVQETSSIAPQPDTTTFTYSRFGEQDETTVDDTYVTLTAAGVGSNEIVDFEGTTQPSTTSTQEYHRKSTLRSVKDRPRLGLDRRTTKTPTSTTTGPERSFKNRRISTTASDPAVVSSTSPMPVNKFLYRYSTTEAHQNADEDTINEARKPSDTLRKINGKPSFTKKTSTTTEKPALEDLGVNTDAVRTRNKNLFSKRKMNTPVAYTPTTASTEGSTSNTETTEASLTTLHHIFAEISPENANQDTTTEAMSSPDPSNSGKLERLIEVNRIVEVKTKQGNKKHHNSMSDEEDTKVEIVPTVNKIGEISRITLIKIVDGDNQTVIVKDPQSNEIGTDAISSSTSSGDLLVTQEARVVEVPAPQVLQKVNLKNFEFDVKLPGDREERKFEIFGESKVANSKDSVASPNGKPEIIDGISHINVVTPKPLLVTEASTISLQGLFQSEKPNLNPSFTTNDEVLETGRSEFVNVRLLDQDKELGRGLMGSSRFIPVRVLPQDEDESTVRAHVMEISPRPDSRTIKIAPIKVEMARSVANFRLPPKLKT